jgi:hypothetical protein
MKTGKQIYGLLIAMFALSMAGWAMSVPVFQNPQKPKKTVNQSQKKDRKDTLKVKAQPILESDEQIPDSLLHPRWKIQRTTPITYGDLNQNATDLKRPDNLKQEVQYNDTLNRYILGTKIGNTWVSAPIMMDSLEYLKWSELQQRKQYFQSKNDEIYQAKGKEKFDFTDMHFDLGPAEKIFGPGGVRIKTQGTAELKFGATLKNIDNPSLPIRNRKMTTMDFDEKINLNVNGKVGDKVNMNLNYNTDATFDFDAQNLKLKYDGKEDEIVKLVEAGNVSFPSILSYYGSFLPLRNPRQGQVVLAVDARAGQLETGLGLIGLGAQFIAVQTRQQLTGLHAVALAHQHLGDAPGDGGAQLDPYQRRHASGEDQRLSQWRFGQRHDLDCGWPRGHPPRNTDRQARDGDKPPAGWFHGAHCIG